MTDEQIQAWADEAERGYDLAELPAPRPGRPPVGKGPGVAVTVRLDEQTLRAVRDRANGPMSPRLHASARKHFGRDRLTDEAVLYAYEHALNSRPLDDEDDPRRWLVVGIDQSGRVLEMVVLVFDGGGELLIHAMKARPQFLDELA